MKLSYDYEDLIRELLSDINEGLIDRDGEITIERGETAIATTKLVSDAIGAYSPVIDYYFPEDELSKNIKYETIKVEDLLEEMIEMNEIL